MPCGYRPRLVHPGGYPSRGAMNRWMSRMAAPSPTTVGQGILRVVASLDPRRLLSDTRRVGHAVRVTQRLSRVGSD